MWPPIFSDFSIRDLNMPWLYDAEAGCAADNERNAELKGDKGDGRMVSRVKEAADNTGETSQSEGRGSSTRKKSEIDVEAGQLHLVVGKESERTSLAPSPMEGTATNNHPRQTYSINTNNNPPPTPAGTVSFSSSAITLMDHHGIIAATGLPPKRFDRFIRNARWTVLSVYHRLHLLVLLPNLIAMIAIGALNRPGLLKTPVTQLATAAAANILLSVLMRQELGKASQAIRM
jgi:hypothetical protein